MFVNCVLFVTRPVQVKVQVQLVDRTGPNVLGLV